MKDTKINPLKLGILASGSGTNLQAILDAVRAHEINVDVCVVISNNYQARALTRAQRANINTAIVSHKKYRGKRKEFEEALIQTLREYNVEWVALAGFMRLLTSHFLNSFKDRVINIHPALLPAFPGTDAQKQAFEYGVKFSGCTVHFVDEGTDTGPIIAQAIVPVLDIDNEQSLKERILEQEHKIYPKVLQLLAENRIVKKGRRVSIKETPIRS